MKMKHVLAAGIPLLGIVIAGCGGGGGGDSSSAATTTTISSAADASKTSSSGTQAATVAANSATSLSGLAAVSGAPKFRSALANKNPRLAKLSAARERALKFGAASYARAKAAGWRAPYGPYSCYTSGTYSYTISDVANPDGSYDFVLTFNNCRDYDVLMNGTMTMNIGTSSITMKTGDGDSVVETTDFVTTYYIDSVSTTALAVYTSSMTVAGTFTAGGATDTFNYTGNGVEQYVAGTDTYTFAMTNFSMVGTATIGTTSSYSITIGGTVTDSWTGGSATVTYTNLALTETTDDLTYADWSINGTLGMSFSPASCFDGTFAFTTVTTVHENLTLGYATAGEITINDNVRIVFKSDGTVDVYYNNALVQNYTEDGLDGLCPISAPL